MSRILVVDDEPSVLDILAALLTDEGYTVQTAPDGRVALELIATEPPDLLITDVMMPLMDGWALLASVRERIPTLPVLVISAVDPTATRRGVFSVGHTHFLRKPFEIDALLRSVQHLTGSPPS